MHRLFKHAHPDFAEKHLTALLGFGVDGRIFRPLLSFHVYRQASDILFVQIAGENQAFLAGTVVFWAGKCPPGTEGWAADRLPVENLLLIGHFCLFLGFQHTHHG